MKVKEFLTKKLGELRSRMETLDAEMIKAESQEARAQIGETIKQLRGEIAETESMLAGIDEPQEGGNGEGTDPAIRAAIVGSTENRNGGAADNKEVRAQEFAKTSRFGMSAEETRSVLVSSGNIATPTRVGGISDPMSSVSSIVDMVRVEDFTGCGDYNEAYMKSWQTAAAGTEGTAPTASDPQYGFVKLAPHIVNVLTYVSREVRKQTPLLYLDKVREGAIIALRKKIAANIVSGAGVNEIYGIVNAVDKASASMVASVSISAIDDQTLRKIVFAYGGDDNLFGGVGVVLILNKKDLIAFGDVRSTTTKQAVYEIIPDGTNPNTGVIKDGGLSIRYCINANCPAFVDASANDKTMIVGDPMNYKIGLYGNYEIEVSDDYKFGEGMLTVRGEVTVGGNVIKDKGFVVVTKAATNP
jgi:HK97 family phage major capsid protein